MIQPQKQIVRCSGAASVFRLLAGLICVLAADFAGAGPQKADVSFRNDVMAVLSKAGCNSGGCHGNANGKGGFKLSLRGEDAEFDFTALTRDQFGRRINPFEPDRSLVLLKATTQLAHEGGKRFSEGSWEYETFRRWIAKGTPVDPPSTPRLVSLEVTPAEAIIVEPESSVPITARATFSDGSERDVTETAVYETSSPLVKVSPAGQAAREEFGEATVLVRFLDQQKPVRLAFIPARPGFQWSDPPAQNFVDEHIFAKLRHLRMNPSELCSDEVFLRRAWLDLLGALPPAEEARAFVASRDPGKRARLIDQLLERPEFADFWAVKWADLLRAEERALDQKGLHVFHRWIRESLAANTPMDQFVREIVAARGSTYQNPAANFYRANRTAVTRAESIAQVFLGVRLQCAQCHSHPFDRWTQNDYYGWAAVFGRVQYKVLENRRQDSNDSHEFKGEQIVFLAGKGEVKNPKTGKPAPPRMLGSDDALKNSGDAENLEANPSGQKNAVGPFDTSLPQSPASPADDELSALAEWLTSPGNPYFARVLVNRVWFNLMGRGVVDPIDDFRATNPASHPELLDALAGDFVRHQFDLRRVIRTIMNSRTYQLSSEPNDTNRDDEINYSHASVRRLSAEQLLDGQHHVTGVAPSFTGYPAGLRAAQLPGLNFEKRRSAKAGAGEQFLKVFGKPPRLLTCECERSTDTTMGQAFQLISGPALNDLLTQPENRLGKLLASDRTDRELIDDLYWTALSRAPHPAETSHAESLLARAQDRRAALEDLAWSLMNAKEFVLRY